MDSQTVAIDDYGFEEDEEETGDSEQSEFWGRLVPLTPSLSQIQLREDQESYSFGKSGCDVEFGKHQFSATNFSFISKKHFSIKKKSHADSHDVILEDLSSNGTLVNGKKVGKNKQHVLQSNDEIALALPSIKIFMFISPDAKKNNFHKEITDKYLVSKLLGKGACGEVFLVFSEGDFSRQFAMKVIEKRTFSRPQTGPSSGGGGSSDVISSDVMTEVNILRQLKHPCIIYVEEILDFPDKLYLVLERALGGELFDRVVKMDGLPDGTAKLYFHQMCSAVHYLHSRSVTHRDLKPENILLATEDEVTLIKVTDFGLSKLVGEQSLMKTLCGTPNYLAPEIVKTSGLEHYTSKVDCWSLGVILYTMLACYPPFSEDYGDMSLREQILNARYTFHEDPWHGIDSAAKTLIDNLLTVNPKKRFSCEQALKSPWMQDEKMMETARKLMEQGNSPNPKHESRGGSSTVESVPKPELKSQTSLTNSDSGIDICASSGSANSDKSPDSAKPGCSKRAAEFATSEQRTAPKRTKNIDS